MTPAPKPPDEAGKQAGRPDEQEQGQRGGQRSRGAGSEAGHLPHDAAVTRVGYAHRERAGDRERERERLEPVPGTRYQVPGLVSSAHCVRVNCLEAAASYVERALRIGLAAMQRASQINSLKLEDRYGSHSSCCFG